MRSKGFYSVAQSPTGHQGSVSWRLTFGPIPFNGFINNPGNGIQYTLSSYMNYRIVREYGRPKFWRAQNALFFQRHLNRPGNYADKSHNKHNKGQVFHLDLNKILRKLLKKTRCGYGQSMIKGYPEVTFCLDLKYVLDQVSYQRTFKNFFK